MIADVAFRRSFVIAWRRLNIASSVADEIQVQIGGPDFLQKFPDHALRSAVIALSKMRVTNSSLRIDNVKRRPVLIVKVLPDPVVVVHYDWIGNMQVPSAASTFDCCFSKENSGVCTPTTTKPDF